MNQRPAQARRRLRVAFLPIVVLLVASIAIAMLATSVWSAEGDRRSFALNSANTTPHGIWSDGTTMWVNDFDDNKLYAYTLANGSRDTSKEFALTAANTNLHGLWSDGTTIWGSDSDDNKIYAYTLSNGNTDSNKDFALTSANTDPRGIWSDGTTMWVADYADNKLYAYQLSDGSTDSTKDFALTPANTKPRGIWSDGTTMWVVDLDDAKIYAYQLSDGSTDSTKDFDTLAAMGNGQPTGLWSDGTTMWVVDHTDDKVYTHNANDYPLNSANDSPRGVFSDGTTMWIVDSDDGVVFAYSVSDKSRDAAKDITTLAAAGNDNPLGLWSDGTTAWISDTTDDKLYAYTLSTKARDAGKDISLHTNNADVKNIWSDATTIWVVDSGDYKLYAYNLSTKARDISKEFDTLGAAGNNDPRGIWSDGATMWVSDYVDKKLYAYNLDSKARVEQPAGTYFQDRALDPDNDTPHDIWSDGPTIWVSNDTPNSLFAYGVGTAITGITVRSVGPEIIQVIVDLANIDTTTGVYFRHRVASPPGAWTTASMNAVANATSVTEKITSGLVAGTEYEFEVSLYANYAVPRNATHTHLGTSLFLIDVNDDAMWEVTDMTDVGGTDTRVGDMTVNAYGGTELDGWIYIIDGLNRSLHRSRTPHTTSSFTNLGTLPTAAAKVDGMFSMDGDLYGVNHDDLFLIADPTNPEADITLLDLPPDLVAHTAWCVACGATAVGSNAYVFDDTDKMLYRITDIADASSATGNVVSQLVGKSVRSLVEFNGRLFANHEQEEDLYEITGFTTSSPKATKIGDYHDTLSNITAMMSWSNNPAPIVSSVSIDSITGATATANITATAATSAGVDFLFRYRIGTSGAWTDASSVNSATTTAAISVTGLTALQAYNYEASLDSAFPDDDRTEGTFTTVAATTQLGKVSGVVLTTPVDNGLTVTWNPVTTAASYRVQWATSSGGQSSSNEAVVSGVTYAIPGLATNVQYFVRVRAETTAAGYTSGLYSDEVSKWTTIPAPTNVATSTTSTTITVTWDAVAGATAYEVWYNASGGTRFDVTGSPPPRTYTITGLITGTAYEVWTAAKIGSAEGRFSARISVTPVAPVAPQAPTDLTLVAGFGTITASWTAPTDTGNAAITGYLLEYQVKGASQWAAIDLLNVVSHEVPSLIAGTTYTVRVAAKNSVGTGPYSAKPYPSVKAEGPPDKPESAGARISISADSSTLSQMEIYWPTPDGNGGGVTSYDLRYRIVGNSTWTTVNQSGTTYNATGLTLHKKYEMQVRATNSHGSSDYSNLADVQFSPRWLYMIDTSGTGTNLSRWSGNSATSLGTVLAAPASDGSDLATLDDRLFLIRSGENKLYEIDPATNLATEVCAFTVVGAPTGLAGLSGDLYLYAGGSIYTLDESSCAVSAVGATGRADLKGMTATDGILYMAETIATYVYLFKVDTSDGSITNFATANTGQAHTVAANGYRLYVPTYANVGGLQRISLRNLGSGREGQRNYGNAAIDEVSGAAVLTMIPAGAPTLTSANPSPGSITLVWSAPSETGTGSLTGYSVQYKLSTDTTWTDWTFAGTGTTTVITSLQSGTSYDVRVAAKNAIGPGSYALATVSPGATTPGVPQSLVLTPTFNGGRIKADWGAPSSTGGSTITGYTVQYKVGTSNTWISWPHTGTGTTSTITGLTNGTEYDVRVAARNLLGTGTYTEESATPNVRLAAPPNIITTPATDNIAVDWGNVTGAAGYVIQWSTTSGDYSASQSTTNQATITASDYQITGLAEDTLYFIRIKATVP